MLYESSYLVLSGFVNVGSCYFYAGWLSDVSVAFSSGVNVVFFRSGVDVVFWLCFLLTFAIRALQLSSVIKAGYWFVGSLMLVDRLVTFTNLVHMYLA